MLYYLAGAMQPKPTLALTLSVLLAPLSLTACLGESATEEDIGSTQQTAEWENGLSANGLTTNGLTTNGLTTNGLTTNGLTTNGLTSNSLVRQTLSDDALSRQFLSYVASCALRPDQQFTLALDSGTYTFTGQLGLAPLWGAENGFCDASCRAWISSCVLSRVNYLGQRVAVSLRGSSPPLATTATERTTYSKPEAAYYGDIFASPQQRYACVSPGSMLITRVCGPNWTEPGDPCVMTVVGDCNVPTPMNPAPTTCGSVDPIDGSYKDCHTNNTGTGVAYPSPITVYRQ